ncbi:hypothetical protein DPMN_137053 [Dreissena polymorpha]|uniref:Uncharacterized protein n=1 Tax=Dreissena polymorpha TaxID=45954 RepID=A0A9D4G1X1_DREPO|nr:hypothetical protein DPMN_137053 [Dreissena polymorpha]
MVICLRRTVLAHTKISVRPSQVCCCVLMWQPVAFTCHMWIGLYSTHVLQVSQITSIGLEGQPALVMLATPSRSCFPQK